MQIILEGQEEIGSPNMQAFLAEHSKLLTADFVVSADGDQISRTQGGIPIALRGATAFDVEAKTLNTDVHSGAAQPGSCSAVYIIIHGMLAWHFLELMPASGRIP